MTTVNVIGDIAGRYDEFMELLAKMPPADLTLAVGDLVDRGPKSKEVLDWFMSDEKSRQAVQANHENMMLEACLDYEMPYRHPYWEMNGGGATLKSFAHSGFVPQPYLAYLETRPAWWRGDGLFVSHAPVWNVKHIPPQYSHWREFVNDGSWVWNRDLSRTPMPGHFMVYGHNARYKEHHYTDADGKVTHYATCIDNSSNKELSGMHWPTKEVFAVAYKPRRIEEC